MWYNFYMEILTDILKNFSKKDILILEEKDRQFQALKRLYSSIRDRELFCKLVTTNALLSYQLQTKGEAYWENFSLYFSIKPFYNNFPDFLKIYNKRLLNAKLKRWTKVKDCIEGMSICKYCKNIVRYVEKISTCLNQRKDAKTIVFSAKMLLYGCRIVEDKSLMAPFEIFIPIDSRISKINKEKIFWENLSLKTGIPLIHIDSILWVIMGLSYEEVEKLGEGLKEKAKKLKEYLKK